MTSIPKTMNAVVAYKPDDYRFEKIPTPVPDSDELLVKIEGCGICAGDVKSMHGAPRFWGGSGFPPYIKAPMIPGHEFIGRVVAVGSNYQGEFSIGDRVISEQIVPCETCKYCKTGRYWMCEEHDVYGFQNNVNGGMAEYMIFPKNAKVYSIPEDLTLEQAILVEPYSCSKHCIDRASINNEDVVVISGVGTLGLGMVGVAKLKNPKTLIVLDLKEDRLALAKKFGADIVLNPANTDVIREIMNLTDNYGCDIYIEATGFPASVKQGLAMLRKMGTFVEFSVFADSVDIDWSIISDSKELNIFGSHLSPYCYDTVISWIQNGKIPTDGVVTHFLALKDFKKGFEIASKGIEAIKVVLVP
jgi:erythritol/L-threitol dehydrogenase